LPGDGGCNLSCYAILDASRPLPAHTLQDEIKNRRIAHHSISYILLEGGCRYRVFEYGISKAACTKSDTETRSFHDYREVKPSIPDNFDMKLKIGVVGLRTGLESIFECSYSDHQVKSLGLGGNRFKSEYNTVCATP